MRSKTARLLRIYRPVCGLADPESIVRLESGLVRVCTASSTLPLTPPHAGAQVRYLNDATRETFDNVFYFNGSR